MQPSNTKLPGAEVTARLIDRQGGNNPFGPCTPHVRARAVRPWEARRICRGAGRLSTAQSLGFTMLAEGRRRDRQRPHWRPGDSNPAICRFHATATLSDPRNGKIWAHTLVVACAMSPNRVEAPASGVSFLSFPLELLFPLVVSECLAPPSNALNIVLKHGKRIRH
jgi:hypothetical protein